MESDRRKFPRIDVRYPIHFSSNGEGESDPGQDLPASSTTRDISMGGISFRSSLDYKPGEMIKFFVNVENLGRWIRTTGRVIRSWQEEGEIYTAVEIVHVSDSDRNLLEGYIRSYSELNPEEEEEEEEEE